MKTRTKRIRRNVAVQSSDESSSDEEVLSKYVKKPTDNKKQKCSLSESSSESEIENLLKPTDKIDLNSTVFSNIPKKPVKSSETIEDDIFTGIDPLSDANSDDAIEPVITSTYNFKEIESFNKNLEEARIKIKQYVERKKTQDSIVDITNLLAQGENIEDFDASQLHSSDFDSCSDENENWEVIKNAETANDESKLTKDVEVTIQLPGQLKKKKGIDLMAAMKRRINRIKKEQQVFVHKVHLLCWIGHGNYVNEILTREELLGLALSLLPSQHCYPSNRIDLTYLEQILKWYRKAIKNNDNDTEDNLSLEKSLHLQINRKEANNKTMFVYIFICILRAMGVNCRVVMSLQIEPLRPPSNELCSLSTKTENGNSKSNKKSPSTLDANKSSTSSSNVKAQPENKSKDKKVKSESSTKMQLDSNPHISNKRSKSKEIIPEKSTTQTKKSVSRVFKTSKDIPINKIEKPQQDSNSQISNKRSKSKEIIPEKSTNLKKESEVKKSASKISKTSKDIQTISKDNPKSKKTIKTCEIIDLSQNKSKGDLGNKIESNLKLVTNKKITAEKSNIEKTFNNNKSTNVVSEKGVKTRKKKDAINQLDGINSSSSDEEFLMIDSIPQVDGNSDEPKKSTRSTTKPTLSKLTSKKSSVASTSNIKKPIVNNTSRSASNSQSSEGERSSYFSSPSKKRTVAGDIRGDIVSLIKGRITEEKERSKPGLRRKRPIVKEQSKSESDSDFVLEETSPKKKPRSDGFVAKVKVKQRVKPRSVLDRRVFSSEEEKESTKKAEKAKKGVDVWLEVFLEAEEMWISVDVVKGQVHCVKEIYSRTTHPVSYILSWDNNNHVKDVTQRYTTNWNTVTRKLRVEQDWWDHSLKPFKPPTNIRQKEEDEDLAKQQLDKPLPTSISEYKNHPLYALKRHLLKFEALYPPNSLTLGFVRKEPVYSRDCVHTLHSREIWVKHAKVVKVGEEPYKIVKARPKYDKLSNTMITDQPLEVFGSWQVGDYIPPTAENGVVPRNAYGNVELFKACMLPKGTVHLQLPGLNKVAKKMNIDCAPAVVGFDFHSGGSHPTFDGYVVCEEFCDVLTAGWYLEQDEAEIRRTEKIEKRVYGNWRRIIKGLLIRERLKRRYDFGGTSGKSDKVKTTKKSRVITDSDSE